MTSKPSSSLCAATFPPIISHSDLLLASAFDLPPNPCLVYTRLSPLTDYADGGSGTVERARLAILHQSAGKALADAVLTSVKAGRRSHIYAFKLSAPDAAGDALTMMSNYQFEGLSAQEPACIELNDIYGPDARLPRKSIRRIFNHFLESVRTRFIDDIVKQGGQVKRDVQRFKSGFVFGASIPQPSDDNWYSGWDTRASTRPLTFVHVDVQLDRSLRLLIHPVLRKTAHCPLPSTLQAGSPITLLPHGTPAYFLADYSPPDSKALDRSFEESFRGLGLCPFTPSQPRPRYVVGWISVENRRGEDKGLTIVYPSRLCLTFQNAANSGRRPLEYIPALPAPLQPSPVLANAMPPSLSTIASASAASSAAVSPLPSASPYAPVVQVAAVSQDRATCLFRVLTAGRPPGDLGTVAREVSGYVDAVAKEREKERERLRQMRSTSGNVPKITVNEQPVASTSGAVQGASSMYPSPPTMPSVVVSPAAAAFAQPSMSVPSQHPTQGWTNIPETTNNGYGYLGGMDFSMFEDATMSVPVNDSSMSDAAKMTTPTPAPIAPPISNNNIDIMAFDMDMSFSDADWNFFDKPASGDGQAPTTIISAVSSVTMPPPPPAPPPIVYTTMPTPDETTFMITPDVLPPSPPAETQDWPETPGVHLPARRKSEGMFDAISFAQSHRRLDDKYAGAGKFAFALPSPPAEDVREESPPPPVLRPGWYAAATDPRVGVVRKLVGVKRKFRGPDPPRALRVPVYSWEDDCIEWEREQPPEEPPTDDEDGDEDGPTAEEELRDWHSRASTPMPPAYLPLGPTLPQTQFCHELLLPLSAPLRPQASSGPSSGVGVTAPTFAPTPVSPAAIVGSAAEKSRSLEAAAQMVGREVVENSLWCDVWRANSDGGEEDSSAPSASDVAVVGQLFRSAGCAPLSLGALCGVQNGDEAAIESLKALETPLLTVGKGNSIVQMLPTALRFWDKLGLGPKSGHKDATVYMLFEDDGSRTPAAEAWLGHLVNVYEARHFGLLSPGTHVSGRAPGLHPIRFDSGFRKQIAALHSALVDSLRSDDTTVVLLILTPLSTMSLSSPQLRHVCSGLRKIFKDQLESGVLQWHFLPEHVVHWSPQTPSPFAEFDHICTELYDRILQPAERSVSRQFFIHQKMRTYFQAPSFTLARSPQTKVSYVGTPAHDLLDTGTLLHVGYQISRSGKWITCACVDEYGEAYDTTAWLNQASTDGDGEDASPETLIVAKVWAFAVQFARKASSDWRIAIAKVGVMAEAELTAWSRLLDDPPDMFALCTAVLCVQHDVPWAFTTCRPSLASTSSPRPVSAKHSVASQIYVDTTATTFSLSSATRLPICLPPANRDLDVRASFIVDPQHTHDSATHPQRPTNDDDDEPDSVPAIPLPLSSTALVRVPSAGSPAAISTLQIHLMHIRHASSTTAVSEHDMQADVATSYHNLAVLGTTRWRQSVDPLLPLHLAATEVMRVALDRPEDCADSGPE
ncbi:mediator complex subunit 13 C-terminal-domain-containing protein [Schizophyllum amplum]|uniref:Mediator of RNA polymerase II transcription subunit 13 n=1 Tax=Schizophyllum amplum TaxID=97359 RepID=A0A550CV22_9AGAR|nr:mediator complex subunit 13 C-terminal-domain-containing protein [Auriculariopsis ampla]